ncbi:nucleoside triphosphate pyrophosphatase [Prochlorococcus sp. MIT 1223]|uniref:nucleoside triphosphate pyrophosphatase n=1 Tax=Prochlorococcus sp. MIT 1223 TaxID=3096217 RepID=UPI002A762EC0|nr:nucleoside triphosphate pyrophosphatase [Prochlorococcus sp. MIT 1223]
MLASASKPRSILLDKAGISYQIMISDVDEESFKEDSVKSLIERLSLEKAKSVSSKLLNKEKGDNESMDVSVILGCDSLFELGGEVFGKPKNSLEAFERLKKMSSSIGYLHTGHCLLFTDSSACTQNEGNILFNGCIREVVSTQIEFGEISSEEIWRYINSGEPIKCAGSFNLEGMGGLFINRINGCYSNVIGLSLPWLRNNLKKIGLLKVCTQ